MIKSFMLSKDIDFKPNLRIIGGGRGAKQGVFLGITVKEKEEINPLEEPLTIKQLKKMPDPIKPTKLIKDKPITVNNEPIKRKKKKETITVDENNRFKLLNDLIGDFKQKSELSESSRKTYENRLKKLEKYNCDYHDYDKTIKTMDEFTKSSSTKSTTACAIIRELRDEYNVTENESLLPLIKNYFDFMKSKSQEYKSEIKKNKLNDREKMIWLDWNKIIKIRNKLSNNMKKGMGEEKDIRNLLLIALYTFENNPPRRLMDYSRMIYVHNQPEEISKELNYCVRGEKFIFNKYKTYKTYGKQEIEICSELREIILKYDEQYEIKGEKDGENLLNVTSDKDLSRLLRSVFHKVSDKKSQL
jgi:hypothetical protein